MKKLITIFIFIILFLFIGMYVMVLIDDKYTNNIKRDILKNTDIKEVLYVNDYDNYYLVKDRKYLYLFDSNYEEIYKIGIDLIHENKNNYDLIYMDNTIMYMDSYSSSSSVIFKYYDIYTYKMINQIVVGDN